MNIFYLIRHGKKEYVKGDAKLIPEGLVESKKTGMYLKDKNIKKIITSPYLRARQTSEEINKILDIDIVVDDRLKERMNWGTVPDQTLEEFLNEWDNATKNRDYIPNGEISSRQAGSSMETVLRALVNENEDLSFAVVSHGGTIMDFVRNIAKPDKLDKFEIDSPEIKGKETSITKVIYSDGNFEIEYVGSVDHLQNHT